VNIHKIGLKIINVYKSEYEIVTQLLKDYDMASINEKLKTFGQLETMIYEVFNLDSEEFNEKEEKEVENENGEEFDKKIELRQSTEKVEAPSEHTKGEDRLASFIKQSVATLRKLIE
jgi:hypothetical protein